MHFAQVPETFGYGILHCPMEVFSLASCGSGSSVAGEIFSQETKSILLYKLIVYGSGFARTSYR